MAIFNSYVSNYQRVPYDSGNHHPTIPAIFDCQINSEFRAHFSLGFLAPKLVISQRTVGMKPAKNWESFPTKSGWVSEMEIMAMQAP